MVITLPLRFGTMHLALMVMTVMMQRLVKVDAAKEVFAQGSALVGGANGMIFHKGDMWVANVYGRSLTRIDRESGEALEKVTDLAFFPDDLIFSPLDDTMYWSDPILGTLVERKNGTSNFLYPPLTYPTVNPVTMSDDGTRLFFAQCGVSSAEGNAIFERNIATGETITLQDGIPLCASNGFDFYNESLYAPVIFQNRVIKLDLANTNQVTDVSTAVNLPLGVKVNSQGILFAVDMFDGSVYKIDPQNPDTELSTEIVTTFEEFNGLDNLAIDENDRIFVSCFSTGEIFEVFEDGTQPRLVSPGEFAMTSGVAILGNIVYTAAPSGFFGYDLTSQERVIFFETVPGQNQLSRPTAVVARRSTDDEVFILSFVANQINRWNTTSQTTTSIGQFAGPLDVHSMGADDLLIVQINGEIVKASVSDFTISETLFTLPGTAAITGDDNHVYVCNLDGTIHKIFEDGAALDTPRLVSSGPAGTEGLAMVDDGTALLAVSTDAMGNGRLDHVDLATGEMNLIEDGFKFFPNLPDFGLLVGYPNHIAIADGYAYVNADAENIIYKIAIPTGSPDGTRNPNSTPNPQSVETPSPTVAPTTKDDDSAAYANNTRTVLLAGAFLLLLLVF